MLDIIIFFSIFAIFLPSVLLLRIFSLTHLLAWETPDSPIPKQAPISLSFSPVCLWLRYIFTFRPIVPFVPKTASTTSNIFWMGIFSTNSFKAGSSLSGFWFDKKLSFIKAINSGLPSSVELTTSFNGLSYASFAIAFIKRLKLYRRNTQE